MVINTGTVIALRCSYCGKFNFHGISLFAFSGNKNLCFNCDCEKSSVIISRTKRKGFVLKTGCGMCEADHIYYLKYKELFPREVFPLDCVQTGLEIGFIGSKDQVMSAVNNQENTFADLVEDEGFEEFFDNPEIMLQILEYLNLISADGSLKCKCGNNNIDLEMFPDCLEMVCNECGNKGLIFAEDKDDLIDLKSLGKIELSEQGIVPKNIEVFPTSKGQFKK